MTREEAIKILKRQADGYYPNTTEALNMAIKALEQEPCEDCVSREAVFDEIQAAYGKFDGIVINPGAYTHTSIALLDAVKAVGIPTVEVHISKVEEREDFRQISYIRLACVKTITGHGTDGYLEAIDFLVEGK